MNEASLSVPKHMKAFLGATCGQEIKIYCIDCCWERAAKMWCLDKNIVYTFWHIEVWLYNVWWVHKNYFDKFKSYIVCRRKCLKLIRLPFYKINYIMHSAIFLYKETSARSSINDLYWVFKIWDAKEKFYIRYEIGVSVWSTSMNCGATGLYLRQPPFANLRKHYLLKSRKFLSTFAPKTHDTPSPYIGSILATGLKENKFIYTPITADVGKVIFC